MTKAQSTANAIAAAADASARASAGQPATAADDATFGRTSSPSRSIGPVGQTPRPVTPPTRRPVVLLVQQVRDDGLEMYAEYLRYSGLAAIAVSNVKDALTFAAEADVIVTGIVLDDTLDGVELVARLRADEGTMHKPIIVLTACAGRRDCERAEHAGCDVFLSKPCFPDALLREMLLLLSSPPAPVRGESTDVMGCASDGGTGSASGALTHARTSR